MIARPERGALASVIGIGASAGGVEALMELVSYLPAELDAPVLVVLHVSPAGTSVLPQLLARRTRLAVDPTRDDTPLRPGTIYVAPPDQHLAVEDGVVRLSREPRENGHRPAVDPMFRSLAREYGAGAVGVVLSGMLDDGTVGLAQIHAAGGATFVQDPGESLYDGMPRNALRAVPAAQALPLRALASRLDAVVGHSMPSDPAPHHQPPASYATGASESHGRTGTRFLCPDCGGVLFEEQHGGAEAYACSVGHAYSPESLGDGQARALESALWAAVRSLEDRAVLVRRLAARARDRGQSRSAAQFEVQGEDLVERAKVIRGVIAEPGPMTDAA